jgi:succinate dehydrogenase/fumarate reductase flavoprotein subunit
MGTESIRTLDTDVAIVGSGGAGLMCVLHLAKNAPELDVTVVSKGAIARSGCTRMVQGGYNAVLDPADSLELHFRDTLEGGKYLNDQEMAWTLVNDAPRTIEELESRVGCFFDRTEDGRIRQKAFGGQNFDRTVHKGDLTGMEIMGKLLEQMERIRPRELGDTRALDLLFDGDGELAGMTVLDVMTGEVYVLRARVVVVAAGGPATMYKIAAPAREKTGDGVAMCYRAGLELRDMEMLQFHPTGLLAGESVLTGAVLEEGLRGAGARMYNAAGERFMERYDPERMERSTRDVVSRASYLEIMAGRGTPRGGVMLDISHLGPEEVERRFPGMTSRSRIIGSDLSRGPIEVSPTAHFHMGGVIVDRDCQTTITGLLVAGEDSGGVHGANRLGGNGVAESTIFGGRAGDRAAVTARERVLRDPDPTQVSESVARAMAPLQHGGSTNPFLASQELKEIMWDGCGVARDRKGLLRTRDKLEELIEKAADTTVPGPREVNYAWHEALDLCNQLEVARVMVESALVREESRGSHFRSDHPEQNDARWLRFIVVRRGPDGGVEVDLRPVKFSRKRPDPADPSAEDLERGEPPEEPGRRM